MSSVITITNTIDGARYLEMLRGGAANLEINREATNSLNVFPVPDGDTGTNMSMTIGSVTSIGDGPLPDVAAAASKAMMRAARGNSGVILSLFFRGIAKVLASSESADAHLLTNAFREGAKSAASAVANPVEGTILTVMRECCAKDADTEDVAELLDFFYGEAERVLAKTPEMLPVLRRAKVVDSGGYGFVRILDGMRRTLHGEALADAAEVSSPVMTNSAADFSEFDNEEIKFGFETLCLFDRDPSVTEEKIKELHDYLMTVGDSIVMTYDDEIFKLHVHSNEPIEVLCRSLFIGTLRDAKIENLRLQHSGLVKSGSGNKSDADELEELHELEDRPEKKPYGIFAVVSGDGMSDLFHELGADAVISGGQSMNPSTDDILRAIRSTPCDTAVILPNNKNIIMAAKQTAEILEDTDVIVVETTTIPEGVSALMAFNSSRSPSENANCMSDAMKSVTTLSVTRAVRDADIDGLAVKRKQYIGLVGGQLKYAADSVYDCIRDMVSAFPDTELCTVYYGSDAKNSEAEEVTALISEVLPDCEVVSIRGNQPVYPYIISLE